MLLLSEAKELVCYWHASSFFFHIIIVKENYKIQQEMRYKMGAIVKFENKRGKTEIKPLTPIDFYTSDLYTTSNRINEIGNKLLLTMEQAATIAGLDFKRASENSR